MQKTKESIQMEERKEEKNKREVDREGTGLGIKSSSGKGIGK